MLFSLLPSLTSLGDVCKTELSKKSNEGADNESGSESGSDSDSDNEASEFISAYLYFNWSQEQNRTLAFHSVTLHYRYSHLNITTPPPEA